MIIYKTTNLINGKIYVGRDKHNNPSYIGSGKLLHAAINKYGKENFIKEIIDSAESIEELNEKEIYWIEKLSSRNKHIGYNIQKGGQGGDWESLTYEQQEHVRRRVRETHTGRKHTKEEAAKMRKSMLGKNTGKRSLETRQKMSKNRKGKGVGNMPWHAGKKVGEKMSRDTIGEKNGMFGKKHSNESKEKIRKKAIGRICPIKGGFKEYTFIKNDEVIHVAKGQSNAINYCKENNLPYSILVKKLLPWNEYNIKTK